MQSFEDRHKKPVELHISPHFFFNVLNSIYHSIKLNPDQAEDILLKFSELMQYYVYDCREEKILLEKEAKNIRNFIALQKMKTPFDYQGNFNVQGEDANQLISPMLFMGIVENVFKNGTNNSLPLSFLKIDFSLQETQVLFSLSFPRADEPGDHSMEFDKNLLSLQNKFEVLYPASHNFQISRAHNVCSIILQVQLDSN